MILESSLIQFIQTKLIKTANLMGIENVIIEQDKVRGIDEKQTTIMLHEHGLSIPFTAMGLTRLSLLNSRLSLSDKQVTVNAVEDEKVPGVISRLDIKAEKYKVDFRAANPSTIKAPKGLKASSELLATITFSDDDLSLFLKASSSMPQRTETGSVCLVVDPDLRQVTLVLSDTNSDDFEMTLDGNVEYLTSTKLVVNYPLKQFIVMMKNNDDNTINICEKNLLKTKINDISIIMLPVL